MSSLASNRRRFYDSDLRPHPFTEEALELARYRHLLWQWASRNLTLRYKRSVLGVLWTLIEPLMIMAILSVVFSALFRFEIPNYPVYVLVGLTFWDFFRRSHLAMMEEVSTSQNLSTRVYLPQSTFAVAATITYLVNWLLSLAPLLLIMLLLDHPITPALLAVPAAMAVIFVFTLGVGLVVATVATFFPDFGLIYQVLLTALMYATPIIYPLAIIKQESFRLLLNLNPLTHLLELVRMPIYGDPAASGTDLHGVLPAADLWLTGCGMAMLALAVGWWIFTKYRDAFSYRR